MCFRLLVIIFMVQLVLSQVSDRVPRSRSAALPTSNDTLHYCFNIIDALGDKKAFTFITDGRKKDWLGECVRVTRELHMYSDVAQFICAQVSFGILRKERPIIHQ
jgi:hypothetical protein